MRHGFIKVAAGTPDIRVADCAYNTKQIIRLIEEADSLGVCILVLPELCITGYTCGDLFLQELLLREAENSLSEIVTATKGRDLLTAVGFPLHRGNRLYNTAAIIQNGKILGVVPKLNIPNYSEFYEARYFSSGIEMPETIDLCKAKVLFGTRLLFSCPEVPNLVTAVEVCEDLWVPQPPSGAHASAGAIVLLNLSASDETTGKNRYRLELVGGQSARLCCAYLYADAGEGESTTDLVFSGHNLIAENGTVLQQGERFKAGLTVTEIDLGRLVAERRRISTFPQNSSGYVTVEYSMPSLDKVSSLPSGNTLPETNLTRVIEQTPFVPESFSEREKRCEEILMIQAMGLKQRLKHTGCKTAVVGISGGLDSTLALLVTKKAFELLELAPEGIIAVTMPCFGTTDRTYQNAVELIRELNVSFREIRIEESVRLHLKEIGHDISVHDVTYENAQARERTQVLMDLANEYGGMVIGTGDMSELALGWATYNGDHMSMYGVNASVPKTLVRFLVAYAAGQTENEKLRHILLDILDTPVSPELLPPSDGEIAQKTEDLVGPYELHDFYLYYFMRYGFSPSKIYRLAIQAFAGQFSPEEILKWLKVFYRRFFSQQFKRSCLPDGPKVGSVALSPRGDLRMPSDACQEIWRKELEKLE